MRRLPELDALRAFAAIAVIALHAGTLAPSLRLDLVMMWGATAVDLFFVISGFLITAIILRERESPRFFRQFYLRRSLRIWPIYYAALLAFVAVNLALHRPFPMDGLGYYLSYTQFVPYYWHGAMPAFCKGFAHTWSLAVEEQFYLIWPALVFAIPRRWLPGLTLAVMALAILSRGWWGFDSQLLITRCDGLALGALLAAVLGERTVSPRWFVAIGLGCLVYLAGITIARGEPQLQDASAGTSAMGASLTLLICNLLFTCMVGLVAGGNGARALAPLRWRPLVYLGQISYGLYLYHNLILALAQRASGQQVLSGSVALAAIGMTLLVAVASWELFEKPILRLKNRFAYQPETQPAPYRKPGALAVGELP